MRSQKDKFDEVLLRLRPEIGAGGYARDNAAAAFFGRVNSLLRPDMVVLDLGAGRGAMFDKSPLGLIEGLAKFQGKVRKVIGLDVDEGVLQHPFLDERHVVPIGEAYPLEDASVDLAVADWVLEHVANPEFVVSELKRVLKPGGYVCARTPNKWGFGGIATRMAPNRAHVALLKAVSPRRQDIDVFPTAYKMNTMGDIRRLFPEVEWKNFSYFSSGTPKYFGTSGVLFRAIEFYQNVVPDPLKTDLIVLLQKR